MKNWSGNVEFQDLAYLEPNSLRELQEVIRENERIRVRGTAHCFNQIADTLAVSVNLAHMPEVLEIDERVSSVTVSAGMTFGQLAPRLNQAGWALSNLASLPHISIAGSVATGTHGSGITNQNLANQILSLNVVLEDGTLKKISMGDELFNPLVVGLGLGAVVYQYEMKIEKTFNIRQVIYEEISRIELQRNFDSIMSTAYSVSYFTDWSNLGRGNLWCKFRDSEIVPDLVSGSRKANQKHHPIPSVNPEACTEQLEIPGPWHERLPHFKLEFTPSVGHEIQSEFFIDIKDATDAISVLEKVASEIYPLLWISEIRTIAADNLWLSGSFQRATAAIHFTWKKSEAIYPLIKKIEILLSPFAYRPHWGKAFFAKPEYLREVFPQVDEFKKIIIGLDPSQKFSNDFIRDKLEFN